MSPTGATFPQAPAPGKMCALGKMTPAVGLWRLVMSAADSFLNFFDEHGRYIIRGTDGTCNATNPINTRNFIGPLDNNLEFYSNPRQPSGKHTIEVRPYGNLLPNPPAFNLVIGFEDMRLFIMKDHFYASATMRELTPDGRCEIVFVDIQDNGEIMTMQRLVHEPPQHEKNWMPIADGTGRWMYRCDEITDGRGSNTKIPCKWDVGRLGGSSQVIPFEGGYLAVVHEAGQIPGKSIRFYCHRFVAFDQDFRVYKITKPWGIHEKGIEYIAGAAVYGGKLVLSYGFMDCEARIATLDIDEVLKMVE